MRLADELTRETLCYQYRSKLIGCGITFFDRLVVDEWLELTFPSSETGQEVLSAVQTLRSMWSHLLEMKLQASESKNLQCSYG